MNLQDLRNSTLSAMSGMDKQVSKKTKSEPGLPYFEEIANKIFAIREKVSRSDIDLTKVEIEIRLGMIVDDKRRWKHKINKKSVAVVDDVQRQGYKLLFKSGIDPIFARKLKAKLSTKDISSSVQPLQILRCDNANNRWQIDSKGKVLMSESKNAFYRIDVALLAHDYDLRINAATENNITDSSSSSNGNGINYNAWQQERHKRRVSYTHNTFGSWRMDFTEVDILLNPSYGTTGGISRTREIEFELEMNEDVKMKWLQESDPAKGIEMTGRIARELISLVDLLVPYDSEDTSETSLMQVDYSDELFKTNDIVHPGRRQFEFLGSMPVNLSRQNLVSVNNTKYYLTEKSDGIRYLMYVINDSSLNKNVAVLVNRSKKAFRFRGSIEIGSFLPPGSILDGELVFNRTFKENVFLIFDLLAWAGVSYVKQNFSVRTEFIQNQVMNMYSARYKQWFDSGGQSQTPQPIMLIRKNFVDKSEILSELLSRLRSEDGERVFYRDNKRHHKSDGIIFQPDSEYVFSRHYDLLKWKWAELRSVDLQVANNLQTDELCLMCGGDEGSQINCTKRGGENIGLGVYDTYRLRADMEGPSMDRKVPAVVEVAYDTNVGMWEYMQLRRDKSEPNYIATVMGVFMEQAESIGVEELEYILNAAACGGENDYEHQTAKMKLKLLDWQRNECAKKKQAQKQQNK